MRRKPLLPDTFPFVRHELTTEPALTSTSPAPFEAQFPAIYDDLRVLARSLLRRDRPGHVLQTTALVHEAFLRFARSRIPDLKGRTHCLALGALAMRHILVEEARLAGRRKRGGDWTRVPLETLQVAQTTGSVDLIALDDALTRLAQHDERKARIVEMRYFGGLSNAEIAGALNIVERTVERDWRYARAWLFRELLGHGAS